MGKVSGLESKESNEKRLETMREREGEGEKRSRKEDDEWRAFDSKVETWRGE